MSVRKLGSITVGTRSVAVVSGGAMAKQRVAGQFAHIETTPGAVTVAAAWMLDPVACAGMGIGAPRVAVTARVEASVDLLPTAVLKPGAFGRLAPA
jgi:hypothetical protein